MGDCESTESTIVWFHWFLGLQPGSTSWLAMCDGAKWLTSQLGLEKEEGARIPISPSKVHPHDWRPLSRPHSLKVHHFPVVVWTGDQAFNTWVFEGQSGSKLYLLVKLVELSSAEKSQHVTERTEHHKPLLRDLGSVPSHFLSSSLHCAWALELDLWVLIHVVLNRFLQTSVLSLVKWGQYCPYCCEDLKELIYLKHLEQFLVCNVHLTSVIFWLVLLLLLATPCWHLPWLLPLALPEDCC